MFFSGKSKQLPYLSDYLTFLMSQRDNRGMRIGIAGAVIGLIGGMTGAALGALAATGAITMSDAGAISAVILLNLGAWIALGAYWVYERKKRPALPGAELHAEARAVGSKMFDALNRRRLHRELNPTVAQLLEESARHWCRATQALNSPFWTGAELPSHWQNIRAQLLNAANQGMEEMLVLLGPSHRPEPGRTHWQDVVEDVVQTYVPGARGRDQDHLPVAYDQARELAEKLRDVANEVERVTKDVSQQEAVASKFRSSSALDMALTDLRSVQVAEEELRQNLQG